MIQAFVENPLLLLFFTIAIGSWLGTMAMGNFRLGVTAVLFLGLGVGALHPDLHIPDFIIYFGLAVFIYAIGLSSAPTFFSNIKQNGTRDIGLILIMLTITLGVAAGLHFILIMSPQVTAGLYAGATTNTPALAGLIDLIDLSKLPEALSLRMSNEAVAAYSLAYPVGTVGTLLTIILLKRWLSVDLAQEEEDLRDKYPIKREIVYHSILITNEEVHGLSIRDIREQLNHHIIFGRVVRGDRTMLSHWDTIIELGDKLIITGAKRSVLKCVSLLGEVLDEDLTADTRSYTSKRLFVSNPEVAGQPISALNIYERMPAVITRIQRGDMELLPSSRTVLELGDMVRFVARKTDMPRLAKIFGDSYESLGRVNLFTLGLGLTMGLFIGMINFQLPGGVNFKLGFAGGPMLMALILGSLRRTGPLVWTMPHGANETIKQFGLALLLAGIGINAGHTFFETLAQPTSLGIILASLFISTTSAAISIFLGYKWMKIPFSILIGMLAHQPAILEYGMEQTKNKLPIIGYTLMLPIALIVKIIFVQMLYIFLS